MTFKTLADAGIGLLRANAYPGRGIVIGMSPDSGHLIQVYWIMGRSENSKNRIFVREGTSVKTEVFDAAKVVDKSLIIYNAARIVKKSHVVTNGDQTDTIAEHIAKNGTFESAISSRTFEPDAPNYTPRISGIADLGDTLHSYKLSILKSIGNNPNHVTRHIFAYEKPIPGVGHCIHTYIRDGNPLPSFSGEPYLVSLFDSIEETADFYWNLLNPDYRVSILVKFIDPGTGDFDIRIINKHK